MPLLTLTRLVSSWQVRGPAQEMENHLIMYAIFVVEKNAIAEICVFTIRATSSFVKFHPVGSNVGSLGVLVEKRRIDQIYTDNRSKEHYRKIPFLQTCAKLLSANFVSVGSIAGIFEVLLNERSMF